MNIGGYNFAGPYSYNKKFVRDFGCVYVLVNYLNQVVDVGQTDNINERIINHPRKMCWLTHGCTENSLYLYIADDLQFRILLEKLVRISYNPSCGER